MVPWGHAFFIYQLPTTGVRALPNCKWSTAKTAGKTVSPGVFPRFGEGDFFFGGLGGVQPPSRAPRLGMRRFFACGAMPRNRAHRFKRDAKTNAERWFRNTRPRNRGHQAGYLTCRYLWSLKKEHIPAARARRKNRLIPLPSVSWRSAPSDRRIPGRWAPPHPGSAATPCR